MAGRPKFLASRQPHRRFVRRRAKCRQSIQGGFDGRVAFYGDADVEVERHYQCGPCVGLEEVRHLRVHHENVRDLEDWTRRANGRDETVAERHAGENMEPHRGGPATTAAFLVRFALPAVGATVELAVDDDTIVAVRDLTIVRRMRLAPLRRRAVRTRVVANDAHLFSAYALSSFGEVVPAPPRAGLVRFGRD
jgi:hypothetical protein